MTGLADRLRDEGLTPSEWGDAPFDRYGPHLHDYDKVLVCVDGSIAFGLAPAPPVELRPGDRLDLPAGTRHDAQVGPGGVRCLEAHLPAGRLSGVVHRGSGSW